MNIGSSELLVVLILALIFFGPKKLPEIGRGIGQALREMKRMSSEVTSAFEDALEDRPSYQRNANEWDDANAEEVKRQEGEEIENEDPHAFGVYTDIEAGIDDNPEVGDSGEDQTVTASALPGDDLSDTGGGKDGTVS